VKALDGKVVVVDDGGGAIGRAVALALAAQGARVVVSGPVERSLGETVGEIAYGGGKARHVVGDPNAAAARAREVFGPVDIVVATRVDCTLPEAPRTVVVRGDVDSDEIGALVASVCSSKTRTRRVTIEA
jgi:NAD(P)-dependent dehydrogenase (short-subunit alcohol dehydrogenase family)